MPHVIGSWKEAQAVAPAIVARLNDNPRLLLAAAANPVLALRNLEYEIAPSFLEEFVDRLRFGPRGAVRMRQLRQEIFSQAGRVFDLNSPSEIEHVLFERMKIPKPWDVALEACHPLEFRFTHDVKDPLEPLRGHHPLIELLLEFRRLNARAPGFAPPDLFEEIRAGKHRIPVVRMHARFRIEPLKEV